MSDSPTYAFEGDKVFAIHQGKVIASGTDIENVQSDASEYIDALQNVEEASQKEAKAKKATHILTPNGLEGEIIGRTPSVWGEQITVRFANGQIARLTTKGGGKDDFEYVSKTAKVASSPSERISKVINETYDHTKDSLTKRAAALEEIVDEAKEIIRSGSYAQEESVIDGIVVAAQNEGLVIKQALEHIAEAEAVAPEAPQMQVFEQADIGSGGSNNWLDVTVQNMIDEAEGQDFEKLLKEGPDLFTSGLDAGALADAGTAREMAHAHIVSKTAGFAGEEVESYRQQFVARVEVARRKEIASRKEQTFKETAQRKASHEGAPDESIFI